jgi:hypothetical protein
MLALLGALVGFVSSAFPTVFGYFQKRQDNAHELEMGEQQIRAQSALAGQKIQAIDTQGSWDEAKALVEAQARPTGVKIVDAISALIRPFLTFYWCVCLETVALAARFFTFLHAGPGADWKEAVLLMWGEDEKAIVAMIFAFWFGRRELERRFGKH